MASKNAIHAKILKAELMGNEVLVEKLKKELLELESNGPEIHEKPNQDHIKVVKLRKRFNEEAMSLKQMVMNGRH